jgi:hypothetical protein
MILFSRTSHAQDAGQGSDEWPAETKSSHWCSFCHDNSG